MTETNHVIEQRARRAARRIGLVATKSRWRPFGAFSSTPYNRGFTLLDFRNVPMHAGYMSAAEVVDYCLKQRTEDSDQQT